MCLGLSLCALFVCLFILIAVHMINMFIKRLMFICVLCTLFQH